MRFPSLACLALLSASACPVASPAGPERSCETVLRYAPAASLAAAFVKGEWNAFKAEPMSRRPDGAFEWKGTLEARDYGYAFDDGVLDAANPFTRWAADTEWSRLRVADCASPRISLSDLRATAQGTLTASAFLERGAGGSALTPAATLDGAAIEVAFEVRSGGLELRVDGLAAGKHLLRVEARDADGREAEPLLAPLWVEAQPFDWSDAVLYFVLVDRFRNGELANDAPVPAVATPANFQGGDLEGLRAAIEDGYFQRLGVNALWLSPLEPSPEGAFEGLDGRQYSGYHGYWPVAAQQVQRRFGGRAALDRVLAAAHARGMRVVLDTVINHVHQQHPRYQQHKSDGWFRGGCLCTTASCSYDLRPLDCWFTPYLPDVNWKSAAAADAYEADAAFWLGEVGFDGFRVDAVKHFEQTGARALYGVAQALGATAGGLYLVGETFAGAGQRPLLAQWLAPPILSGQFDFPLYWQVVDSFARGQSLARLDAAVAESEAAYPADARMSVFLGNHDVPRFLSIAAGQIEADPQAQAWSPTAPPETVSDAAAFARLAQAFTFLLTARGVPLIYYGDEIGRSGAGDPDNRRPMKWGALTALESGLRAHLETLGAARRQSVALRRGDRATLAVEADLWVQQRSLGAEGALVVLHRGAAARAVTLAAQGDLAAAPARRYRDAITGAQLDFGGAAPATLTVPAGASMVFLPAP